MLVMYMCKQKLSNDDKNIEVINIYEDNGEDFEDILTETIKILRYKSEWLSNTKKVNKEDFSNVR